MADEHQMIMHLGVVDVTFSCSCGAWETVVERGMTAAEVAAKLLSAPPGCAQGKTVVTRWDELEAGP